MAPVPIKVQDVINSSSWTSMQEDFVAKNATDEESKIFESKIIKPNKLNDYLKLREYYKKLDTKKP